MATGAACVHGPGEPPGGQVGVAEGVPVAVGVGDLSSATAAEAFRRCRREASYYRSRLPARYGTVPSVSVGKLRRAVANAGTGVFTAQVLLTGS